MNTYLIKSFHDVYLTSYKQGELKHVNCYDVKAEVKADNEAEAIRQYFENTLYFSFKPEFAQVDEDEPTKLWYDNIVNVENEEATTNEIKVWRMGKSTLYNNTTQLKISIAQPLNINL